MPRDSNISNICDLLATFLNDRRKEEKILTYEGITIIQKDKTHITVSLSPEGGYCPVLKRSFYPLIIKVAKYKVGCVPGHKPYFVDYHYQVEIRQEKENDPWKIVKPPNSTLTEKTALEALKHIRTVYRRITTQNPPNNSVSHS